MKKKTKDEDCYTFTMTETYNEKDGFKVTMKDIKYGK